VDALRAGTQSPPRWVVVDTGSRDGSAAIAVDGLRSMGADVRLVEAPVDASYGAAVRAGLAAMPAEGDGEWIWLLHDDSAPAPHCFERLAELVAEDERELVAVGPKQREWPSLKRLLEVGVTLTGTGRRETGLETGEYDQGQHDEYTAVLAVNTAGMLVRRDVLERFGFADELPLFGNDLDFGWRVASAGHVVRIVPTAVMFHAEAAHRGQRDAALAVRPQRDERVAAMFTVLANGSARAHPVRLVRLFLGGLLRALGYLLVRAPREARAELSALAYVYGHAGRMRRARKARRSAAVVPDSAVAPLLAPFWMPWRHGLDFVIDVIRAVYHVGQDSLARRRAGSVQHGPLLERLVRSPSAWGLVAVFVVAVVAGRGMLTGAPLEGGALLAAPDGVGHWWGLWADRWHWVGQGTAVAGPPYTFPLAVVATLLLGNPGAVVWLLFLMTAPLCYLGAVRFFRRLCPGRWTPAWAAATYAILPVMTGSVGQGRLGSVAVAVLLPWVATSALALSGGSTDRRRRALWRTILGLGIMLAFAPALIVALLFVAIVLPWLVDRPVGVGERVLMVAVPALMSLSWLPVLGSHPQALLVEAGRADIRTDPGDVLHLLAGSAGGPGTAPWWLTIGLAAAAFLAFARPQTRVVVTKAWVLAAFCALCVAVLARVSIDLPGLVDPVRVWPGAFLVVVSGCFVTAIAIAAHGLSGSFSGLSFGWRQPVAALALIAAVAAPVGGAAWWLGHGAGGPLRRADPVSLPAYLTELGAGGRTGATLVVEGGAGTDRDVVGYRVVRGTTERLGDAGLLAVSAPDDAVTRALGAVFAPNGTVAAKTLADRGIAYVYAPAPVSSVVAGAFDAASGFESASAPRPRTRAWQVVASVNVDGLDHRGDLTRPVLVLLQLLVLLAVLVMAAPSRPSRLTGLSQHARAHAKGAES